MRSLQPTEHSLQVQVLDYLYYKAKRDIYWFAVTNAGERSLRMGARMKAEGMRAGVADLCIMMPGGRCAWLEMKTAKGRQSIAQKGFQAWCARLGHPYVLARSLEEAETAFKAWEILK